MRTVLIGVLVLAAGPAFATEPQSPARRFGDERFRVAGWPIASALSADGSRLAVLASVNNAKVTLQVFDAGTGRPVCRGEVDTRGYRDPPGLAFSPDGKYVAASAASEAHVVWAADTGRIVLKLPLTKEWSGVGRFTPDGRLVVTGDKATDLYDVPSGKVVATWPTPNITRLSADGRTFARIDSPKYTVGVGDAATGTVFGTLPVAVDVKRVWSGALALSADGAKLAVVPGPTKLQVWDVAARRMDREADIPPSAVDAKDQYYAVRFSPDGRTVALETKRGAVYRWDARSLVPQPTLEAPWAHYVRGVHWSKDGRTVLAVADNGLVNRWDANTGKLLPHAGFIGGLRFGLSADGGLLVVGDRTGRVDVYDTAGGTRLRRLDPGRGGYPSLQSLAVSPDGTRVVASDTHGGIIAYRTDGGRPTILLPSRSRLDPPDYRFLAWAADNSAVYVSDGAAVSKLAAADGLPLWQTTAVSRCVLTPDGRFVVNVCDDRGQVIDAATGKVVRSFPVTSSPTMSAYDKMPRALAAGANGDIAVVLDQSSVVLFTPAGKQRHRFVAGDLTPPPDFNGWRFGERQHPHPVNTVAFTPDGKWLLTGGDDLAVKVWEVATGKLVLRFDGSDSSVEQVAASPDGRLAYAAGGDGFVARWDLSPKPATGQTPEELWSAAADADPAVGVPAAWALAGGSTDFLGRKLPPAASVAGEQIDRWIADLGAAGFAAREAATKALADRGRLGTPALRAAAKSSPSAEARRRAEALLNRLDETYSPDELRSLRLVQACEWAGHRELLSRWAGGAAGAVLTEDAKAAVKRLTADARR